MRELDRIETRRNGLLCEVAFEGEVEYEADPYLRHLVKEHLNDHIVVYPANSGGADDGQYVHHWLEMTQNGGGARITAPAMMSPLQEKVENKLAAKLRRILEEAERLAELERELDIIRKVRETKCV